MWDAIYIHPVVASTVNALTGVAEEDGESLAWARLLRPHVSSAESVPS